MRPGVDHLVVALTVRDVARLVGALEALHSCIRVAEQGDLVGRDLEILDADGHAAHGGVAEAELLEPIEELHGGREAVRTVRVEHQLRERALLHLAILVAQRRRHDAVEQHASRGGSLPALAVDVVHQEVHRRVEAHPPEGERHLHLGERRETRRLLQLLRELLRLLREEVAAEHDVLARLRHRAAVGRLEDVVAREHEQTALELRLERERHVHGHLVAVEVGVERRADERVDTDGLPFHEHRLERLDSQTVERRRAVQQHRVVANYVFEDLVHLGALALHDLLGALHRLGDPLVHQLVDDERLEELERHRLRQTALVQLELRAHHDHRTTGVVHALAEQVLTEAALLALEHVRERLQRTLPATADRLGAAAVVEERIDRFLQHALLVAQDDLGRPMQYQLLQPVVPVDHSAIEIVQIARGEAAAIERNERAKIGRDHGDHVHDHPLRLVARTARISRPAECVDDLEPLEHLLLAMLRRLHGNRRAELVGDLVDVQTTQQLAHRGRPDVRLELGVAGLARLVAELQILVLIQELVRANLLLPRLDHHVVRVVDDLLEVAQRDVQQVPHRARKRLEEPDVSHGHGELDVPHPLAADARKRNLHAAAVADHAAIADPLVLPAMALPVLHGTEDPLAEETVLLGLERAIVDGLGLRYLAPRPPGPETGHFQPLALLGILRPADLLGRRDADLNEVETRAALLAHATEVNHVLLLSVAVAIQSVAIGGAELDPDAQRLQLLH